MHIVAAAIRQSCQKRNKAEIEPIAIVSNSSCKATPYSIGAEPISSHDLPHPSALAHYGAAPTNQPSVPRPTRRARGCAQEQQNEANTRAFTAPFVVVSHRPRPRPRARAGGARVDRHSGIERAAARPCAPMQAKIRSAHGRDRARDRDRPTRAYWPRCRRCCCPYKARRRQRPLGRARVVLLLPARQGCPHCLPGRARARALARPIVSMYVHFRYVLVCYDSIDLAYSVILIPFTRHT